MPSQGAVVFSCARDRDLAELAVATIPAGWPVCVVIAPEDLPAFSGFRAEQIIVCDFPRGRTLDGGDAVLGVTHALRLAAEHIGNPLHLAKVDSDCLLYDPGFLDPELAGPGIRGFAHHLRPGATLGLAYAMETALISEAEAVLRHWMKVQNPVTWGEDVAITTAAAVALGSPFDDCRRPFSAIHWERFDGATPGHNKLAGHYRGRTNLRKLGIIDEPTITARALETMQRDIEQMPDIVRRQWTGS